MHKNVILTKFKKSFLSLIFKVMGIQVYTDEKLIKALRGSPKSRNEAIKKLCTNIKFRDMVFNYIKSHGGNEMDAQEVFNDTVLNFVKSVVIGNYNNNYSVRQYLHGIARHLWLKKYAWKIKHQTADLSEMVPDRAPLPDIILISMEKKTAVRTLLRKMDKPSRQLLELWAAGYSTRDIASQLDLEENYTRLKIHRCKRKLEKLLLAHPDLLKTMIE